jgi:hypothetical protein
VPTRLHHAISLMNAQGHPFGKELFFRDFSKLTTADVIGRMIGIPSGSWVLSRSLADEVFPLPAQLPYEDVWISIRVKLKAKRIVADNRPHAFYRQHAANTYGKVTDHSHAVIKQRAQRDLRYAKLLLGYPELIENEQIRRRLLDRKEQFEAVVKSDGFRDIALSSLSLRQKLGILVFRRSRRISVAVTKFTLLKNRLHEMNRTLMSPRK